MTADEILETEFLQIRARILEVAAALDRLDLAQGAAASDDRYQRLMKSLRLTIDSGDPTRAQQVQMLFSEDYDPQWRQTYGMIAGKNV